MTARQAERGFSIKTFLLLLVIASTAGYAWYAHQQQQAKMAEANQFITIKVKRGSISYTVNASGMIYPSKTVKVGQQATGEISKLTVKLGDFVKEGDLIAEIDARTQQNSKDTATAQLAAQQAALSTAQAALTKAQQAYTRANTLYKRGAGTQEDAEAAHNTLIAAKNSVAQAQANLRQSQLTLDNANVNLGYTRITAPISGTVIAVAVEEGQSQNAMQTTPTLVTIAKTDVMEVKAEIAEADISVVKPNLPATFTLLGKNTKTYTGTLESIDPAPKEIADNGTISSSTAIYYYGHIKVPNPDNELKYGMTATISIQVAKAENALIVPMTAIKDAPNGKTTIDVLKNGKPEPRLVTVGLEDGVNAEIKEGLQEGEEVIISNGSNVQNNGMGRRRPGPF